MRKISPASLRLAFILSSAILAGACGDKLLFLGHGVDFATFAGHHKASVIAYVPATLPQSAAISDPEFHTALRKAGHKLRLVQEKDVLTEAVQSGRYDLVLVDDQDAPAVEQQVTAAAVNTIVMPVVYEGAAQSNPPGGAHLDCVRKVSGKNRDCSSAIDKALKSKLKRDEQASKARQ